jgi:O-antigen ligase
MNKQIYNNLVKINSFFLYILPISLVTGPFIPNLIVNLICFIGLFLIIYNKQLKRYFTNSFFKFFLIFSIYLIINSILNRNFNLNGISGYIYIRYIIFSIAIWHTLENNINFYKNFTRFVLLFVLLLFIDSIFQYFNETDLLGIQKSSYHKISSFFGIKVKLGAYLARIYIFLFMFIYLFLDKKLLNIVYLNIVNLLFATIILLTGERTSFFIFILNFFIINFTSTESLFKKISTFIIVVLASGIILVYIKDVKTRFINDTVIQVTDSKMNNSSYNIFSKIHESHYRIAYNMFSDSKFFGQGPNSFRILCSEEKFRISENFEGCSTHPHNIYMQLLAETGLIGFLFLLIAIFYIYSIFIIQLLKIYKLNKNFKNRIYFYGPIVVYLFPFMPTGNFFNSWVNIMVYLPMGFLLYEVYSKND